MAAPLTDSERLTQLEQQLATAIGRIAALEAREAQREGKDVELTPTDSAYLQEHLLGAVEGSQQAETLNHLQ